MGEKTSDDSSFSMPTIKMSREIKLAVNWGDLAKKLIEVLAQGVLTALGGDGISGGISALVDAAGAIKLESEPGEKAWSLSILCFAWALDELKTLPGTDFGALREVLKDALRDAKKEVDKGGEHVPLTFLERPTTLPLYRALRDAVVARKATFRFGISESPDALRNRFDAAYDRAMFEILSRRTDVYQSLISTFSLPGVTAAERQINWAAYRKKLIFDFEVKPVFGQEETKLSLSQLYVPLRGYWLKESTPPDSLPFGGLAATHDIKMLDTALDEWLDSSVENDVIRLVGGGPGSGKSTTLRAFARRVADRSDWRLLFIPLQHIDLESDLRESINRYFVDRTSGSFTLAPLSRVAVEDGPPLLLIFDGLDELARPGEAAHEVVNLFSTKLANLISSLRGDGSKSLKVVVSGRMLSFQAARRYISPPKHGCLEVYGFTPELRESPEADRLWNEDQRPVWWRQYATLVGISPETPPAFSNVQLQGITHEPLLCYLLVLSGFAVTNAEQAAENPNRIYETLVDSIWYRGWGDGAVKRQGGGRTLSKYDFNILMQTIALAAWLGGDTRVASEQGFASAVKIAQAENAWDNFKNDNGPDVTNLAMNFYLKASEGSQRGFEFTHKSFGDYLAARAILGVAEDLQALTARKIDHAMTDWVAATGTGTLTSEILNFLRDEVRLRASDHANTAAVDKSVSLKVYFEQFVSAILVDGLPASSGGMSWRLAEARQRNGEIMAWAVLNSLSLTLAHFKRPEKLVSVQWPDEKASLHQLLSRISDLRNVGNPALKCFSYVVAPGADLFGLSLMGIDFRGAQLQSAMFAGCHLIGANFMGANLVNCIFQRTMLDQAKLEGASLKGADLTEARMEGTYFDSADFEGSIVSESTLLYADLDAFITLAPTLYFRRIFFNEPDNRPGGDIFARAGKIRKIVRNIPREARVI